MQIDCETNATEHERCQHDECCKLMLLDPSDEVVGAELMVEPTELGGAVVSNSAAPSSSRRNSRNSMVVSLIDWYRSSGSFARQRRTMRVRSAGAFGFASFTSGTGACTILCRVSMVDPLSKAR